jgi:hypothetical protein
MKPQTRTVPAITLTVLVALAVTGCTAGTAPTEPIPTATVTAAASPEAQTTTDAGPTPKNQSGEITAWDVRDKPGQGWADGMMRHWLSVRGWTTLQDARDYYPAGDVRGTILDCTAPEAGHLEIAINAQDPTREDLYTIAEATMGTLGHSRPGEIQATTVTTADGEHSATFTCAEVPGCRDAYPRP